jgi:hypothetical protein
VRHHHSSVPVATTRVVVGMLSACSEPGATTAGGTDATPAATATPPLPAPEPAPEPTPLPRWTPWSRRSWPSTSATGRRWWVVAQAGDTAPAPPDTTTATVFELVDGRWIAMASEDAGDLTTC